MLHRLALLLLAAVVAPAAMLRIEVRDRSDVLDGKPFGAAGPYERITGKAFFAVDPTLAANKIIADIGNAPRNENGLVEFSSDVYVLKPRDPAKGNGAVLYEVCNRGRKGMLTMFNLAAGSLDPREPQHFGDAFLLDQGYTLVWLGWQFDVPEDAELLRLYTPIVKGVTGPVRAEFIPNEITTRQSVADRSHVPYPVLNPDDPKLTLTVRDRADGTRRAVPRSQWKIEAGTHVVMASGFEPGKIYELVYTTQDSPMAGLGPAAVRDFVSFLKYGDNAVSVLGDQRRFIKRVYGFGSSQSGRFLRTFLYYGFNSDEQGRQVLDGVLSHVAGGGRGSFNLRFAQPSRDGHPFFNTFYPTDIFPFTDVEQTDPETGITDGLLNRARKGKVVPKIFYTNSSYEYWGRSASLIHTTPEGSADAEIPPETRIYLLTGAQHGPGSFPPSKANTQNLTNPNDFRWIMRALLVAMDSWVKDGVAPPPSRYPRFADDNLTPVSALRFPKIAGVAVPARIQKGYRVDYGPEFRSKGVVSIEPPGMGKPFPMFVPQVGVDGNELSGVRMPEIQAPIASYTGWNLRTPNIGAPDELYSMAGSFIPYAKTKAQRSKTGDPRLSIEERYSGREDFLKKFESAARSLAASRYLLEQDLPRVLERGPLLWDYAQRQ
jgi:hypothetical protein